MLENGSADPDRILDDVCERFGLEQVERQKVHSYLLERGAAYLDEKPAVVAQEPRKNSAKALLAVLRDDWKPAVEIKKRPRPKTRTADTDSHQETEISPAQAKKAAKTLQEFRMSLMTPGL